MTVTLNLKPEDEAKLNALAEQAGCDADCVAQRIIEEKLAMEPTPTSNGTGRMTDEELEAKLRAAGVRHGSSAGLSALLRSWNSVDGDPESTVEEYEEILRNIEEGGLELHRIEL